MEGFLGLAAFVFAWVVIVHLGKKKNWGGLKRHGLGFLAAVLTLGIVGVVLAPPQPSAAPAASQASTSESDEPVTSPAAEQSDVPTLALSLDQYVENFNSVASELTIADRASLPSVVSGPINDTANVKLTGTRSIVLTLTKGTRDIRGLTFIGEPNGDQVEALHLMTAAGVAVHAAFPQAEREQAAKALGKLLTGLEPEVDSQGVIVGDKRIWASVSKFTGLLVGVSPAAEK